MLFISHHHKVIARNGSIDDEDLKLFIIWVIGIEALALVLTAARDKKSSYNQERQEQIFFLHIYILLLFYCQQDASAP